MTDDNWDRLGKTTDKPKRSSLEKKVGQRMVELEELVVKLNKRIDGLSYLVKKSI